MSERALAVLRWIKKCEQVIAVDMDFPCGNPFCWCHGEEQIRL